MTNQTPASKNARWYPSTYREDTRPSVFFRLTAGLFVIVWLLVTGWIVTHTTTVGSPDEAANAYFISRFAATGGYTWRTSLTTEQLNLFHPRSMLVQGTNLLPGSFLGLVQIGGLIDRWFGTGAVRMFTPLMSLVALIAIYLIARRFWGRWWALLTAVLVAGHPVFFQFATLPYLHNGLNVAGLVIAAWALIRLLELPTWPRVVFFGLLYGLALYWRPVEVLWSGPIVAVLLLARAGGWRWLMRATIVTLMVQLPWLLTNRHVYGSLLSSAYTPTGLISDVEGAAAVTAPVRRLFTPAGGVWSWHWLSSGWWYFVLLLPTWSAMSLIALVRYFRRKFITWSKSMKLTLISLITLFPFIYYGSWDLYPGTPAANVGSLSSYARYWIPWSIAMVAGVMIVLRQIRWRWLLLTVIGGLLMSQGVMIVAHPVSGLRARFASDQAARTSRSAVLADTPAPTLIIAAQHDKYLYPDRLVGFRLPQTHAEWQTLRQVTQQRPVYLYVTPLQYRMDDLRENLRQVNLTLQNRRSIGHDELWQITSPP